MSLRALRLHQFTLVVLISMYPSVGASRESEYAEITGENASAIFLEFAEAARANFDRISTWKGSCLDELVWSRDVGSDEKRLQTVRLHKFAVDLQAGSIASSYQRIGALSSDGLAGGMVVREAYREVMVDGKSLTYIPGNTVRGLNELKGDLLAPAEVIYISEASDERMQFEGDLFDPRAYFRPINDTLNHDDLAALAAMARSPSLLPERGCRVAVAGQKDSRKLRVEIVRNGNVLQERIYDESAAGNIVELIEWPADVGDDQEIRLEYHWRYDEIAGVEVPVEIRLHRTDLWRKRTITIKDSEINQPIAAGVFGLAYFSPSDGTYVVDKLNQVVSTWQGGTLERIGKFGDVVDGRGGTGRE